MRQPTPKSADFAANAKKKSAKKNVRPNCNAESLATELKKCLLRVLGASMVAVP
jgi:hypothetical protein